MAYLSFNYVRFDMSIKIDRINNMIVEEISKIIHEEIKDKEIGFVTITDARITSD